MRVDHKVVVVTGAASGIGRATAEMLASQGAAVCAADIDLDGACAVARSIVTRGGTAAAHRLDVTDESLWETFLRDIVTEHGRLDILVSCAGVSAASPVTETTLEDWRRVMRINLDGVFLGTKHAIRAIRASGGPGSIVNVASASGIRPSPGAAAYSASKAAVCAFSRAVAKECLQEGWPVRVNTVCPGGVKTALWSAMPFFRELVEKTGSEEAAFEELSADTPSSRFAEPSEIAAAILYLASDESLYVTGTDLVIDGGYAL